MDELEIYFRTNLYARDYYLDIDCYPMCIGCPYFRLGCDIVCSCECEWFEQIYSALEMGF